MYSSVFQLGGLGVVCSCFFAIGIVNAGDLSKRFSLWENAIESIPEQGFVKYNEILRDETDVIVKRSYREVIRENGCSIIRTVVEPQFNANGKRRQHVALVNPYYSAELLKVDDGRWVLKSLSVYTDEGYDQVKYKLTYGADCLDIIRNYNGIRSILESNLFKEIESGNRKESKSFYKVAVEDGPGIEKYSKGYSPIEYFEAEFSTDSDLPTKVSGKHRDRQRFFSMELSDWTVVGNSKLPQMLVAITEDQDQAISALLELELDFESIDDSIDASIFYLAHYGIPEPEIPTPISYYFAFGLAGLLVVVSLSWFGVRHYRKSIS